MAVPAKFAVPYPSHAFPPQPALEESLEGKSTLFTAPPGYLLSGYLSGLIGERGGPTAWLRVGPEDRDPATLLLSLITGIEDKLPSAGARTLETMRNQPGGVYGWTPLFACLAQDVCEAVGRSSNPEAPLALVIQHIDILRDAPRTMSLLWDHFLPLLPNKTIRILTSHAPFQRGLIPTYLVQHNRQDLRLDESAAASLLRKSGSELISSLPPRTLSRLIALADGRGEAFDGLMKAFAMMGSVPFKKVIDSANNITDLLAGVARGYLDTGPARSADLLALALKLEYINPSLIQAVIGSALEVPMEWMQPLSDRWARLRCLWRDPLRVALRPAEIQNRELVERAAHYLIEQGAYYQGIPLLFDLGYLQEAARSLVEVVEPLMDRGQWETLFGWLSRLPESVRHDWPWLVYAEGELAAARGQARSAGRIFSTATRLFYEHRDIKGACQSLLTESTLAAWEDELPQARAYARQAQSLAQSAGLHWFQSWAGWQMGNLAVTSGNLAEAYTCFISASFAARAVNDARMIDFIEQACQLAQSQLKQGQQKEELLRAYQAVEQAEKENGARLHLLLKHPYQHSAALLSVYGWSQVPLFLKLPAPEPAASGPLLVHERLLGLLRGIRWPGSPSSKALGPDLPPAPMFGGGSGGSFSSTEIPTIPIPTTGDFLPPPAAIPEVTEILPPSPDQPIFLPVLVQAEERLPEPAPLQPEPGDTPALVPTLNGYLLGKFQILIDHVSIENWPSGRARSVFAFLLTQRGHPVPREVIMEMFWPDSSQESARNSLNVAIHSLRQTIKAVYRQPIVIFHDNAYQISPALVLWLDFDVFELHVTEGRRAETGGQSNIDAVIHQYEAAINLYQGDLLAENVYEDWPALERERLRMLYLETLDHLSQIYYNQGQYPACAGLCQRILAHDNCREDAHCRLMRCYQRQGQSHLALRQYQICVESLHKELDVAPSESTIQLYEQIRRHEPV